MDQDLRRAATSRLERSAVSADRLIGDHLRGVAERYAAISLAPEFRANIGASHGPTLRYYAAQLLEGQSATVVAFLGRDGELLALASDPRLVDGEVPQLPEDPFNAPATCAAARGAGSSRTAGPGPIGPFEPCRYPDSTAEATLFRSRGNLYALARVPLRTGDRLVGGLAAVEPVSREMLAGWSELSGGTIHLSETLPSSDLDVPIRGFGGLEVRISTTYQAERDAIRRARRNLAASGLGVLALALVASLLLARGFARPIVQMRKATEQLSEGRLDQRLDIQSEDEIGQLGRAFNDLVSRLRESREQLRRAQRLARFGNWDLAFDTWTVDGTAEFHRLFVQDEGKGRFGWDQFLARIHPDDRQELQAAVARSRQRGAAFRVDVRIEPRPGRHRILHLRGQPRGENRARIEASAQDVTERRTAEEQIRYVSLHDPLTGLGNREYLRGRLTPRLRGHHARQPLALLLIGLDDFQEVNHAFGYPVGDAVLAEVAERLVDAVRKLPNRRRGNREVAELVVRLGDDRFGVVLDGAGDEGRAAEVSQLLLAELNKAHRIEGEEISLTACIGIGVCPEDGEDVDTLLRNCDTALHRCRQDGPGLYGFFHESMHHDASRRLRVSNLLRQALDRRELVLHFQPRVRTDTARVVGFEALARWTDPELGSVSPVEFIPIAETTGSIVALTEWSLDSAARQLRAWHDSGYPELQVSLNLSRYVLVPELVERVLASTADIDRSHFELEVTESALIEDGDAAISILSELRTHGFRIALDDFGTGYSSLSYLQDLPIDTVKIDRGFIQEIGEDQDAAALTGSVLAMCGALRLHAVVEGIETQEQREILLQLGCAEAQGFLFSKPIPSRRTLALLRTLNHPKTLNHPQSTSAASKRSRPRQKGRRAPRPNAG